MMTKKQIKENPLGSKACIYLEKKAKNGAIHLKPEKYTLEFYPTGCTKYSPSLNGAQVALKALWNLAVVLRTEDQLYPFKKIDHNICLVHQRDNPEDKHAMFIVLVASTVGNLMYKLDGLNIGWCPKCISKQIYENLSIIKGGRILKVCSVFHKRYYTAKVVFGYGESELIGIDLGESTRFIDIMDEIS